MEFIYAAIPISATFAAVIYFLNSAERLERECFRILKKKNDLFQINYENAILIIVYWTLYNRIKYGLKKFNDKSAAKEDFIKSIDKIYDDIVDKKAYEIALMLSDQNIIRMKKMEEHHIAISEEDISLIMSLANNLSIINKILPLYITKCRSNLQKSVILGVLLIGGLISLGIIGMDSSISVFLIVITSMLGISYFIFFLREIRYIWQFEKGLTKIETEKDIKNVVDIVNELRQDL
jgi:hypothetical protein